jgi:hypothetical protein
LRNDVGHVGFEVAVESDQEQYAGIVIKQNRPEIVDCTNAAFPVSSFSLKLCKSLAKQLATPGHTFPKRMISPRLPIRLPGPSGWLATGWDIATRSFWLVSVVI